MNVVPCKDCNCRYAECHASCPLYNKWKTEYEIVKQKVRQQKELDINYVDYVLTQRSRIVRAKCGTRTRKIVAQI